MTDVGIVATEAARTEETRTDLAKGLTGIGTGAVTKTKAGTEMTGAKGERVAGMMGTDVARETRWTSMLILRSPQSDLNQMTEWMVPRRRHHHLEDPLLHLPGIAQAAERLTGETARVTETAGTMTGLADALAAHETNLTTIITIEGTETPDAGVIGVVHPATTKTMDVAVTEDPPHRRLRLRRLLRSSPSYEEPVEEPLILEEPREDDSEARSVFVSQLAARLTARDLGYFFEDKLGEGTVMDSRIVTDRLSRRSKGIGYVEFRTIELVDKALALRGTVVMGLPIMVQLTESERNKLHAGDGNLNLPPGVTAPQGGAMQLYVGSLHFNLTEADIKQVFEPFGELEFVDLHRDPMTGRSKGYAFVQYKKVEDARMALEQMEGFELAGRTLRVNTVHEKGTAAKYTQADTLDESGGGNLNAASRQALMQKLARIEPAPVQAQIIMKPNIPQAMQSESVLLVNMFDPEEETERDWDKELAEEVRAECEDKYGPVSGIKVEKETQGEIYIKFKSIESAQSAIQSLNGRYFGGRSVSAAFISNAIFQAHQ
ncbi:splicing factor, CC1-like protein [Athelia psychrophila]|uniref:Splicing factor, CC1-like protein n=1 Tax=Athelia psychrophila TaxID=1759441 RepID=A0A166U7E3_9AGAM|nr:splicing factor, CC1-like protein [Fibularhizoctonia sp. CBS 109695]